MAKKRGKAKWIILGIIVVVLILLALNFNKIIPYSCNAQNKSFIDPDICKEFDNGKIGVIVFVQLDSREATDKLLSSLPQSDFKLRYKSNDGISFSGNTTKRGLSIIAKSPNVISVGLVGKTYAA